MDKTEQNLKMLSKAHEIQDAWQPKVGDWFLHDWHGTTGASKEFEETIWPDKDQWEEIECLTYKPSVNDYIEISRVDGSHGVYTSSSLLKDRHIWIPSQSDLQEMVDDTILDILESFHDFIWHLVFEPTLWKDWQDEFYANPQDSEMASPYVCVMKPEFHIFTSMEQLWLAFCQKELYGKVWNNEKEDWVKDNT